MNGPAASSSQAPRSASRGTSIFTLYNASVKRVLHAGRLRRHPGANWRRWAGASGRRELPVCKRPYLTLTANLATTADFAKRRCGAQIRTTEGKSRSYRKISSTSSSDASNLGRWSRKSDVLSQRTTLAQNPGQPAAPCKGKLSQLRHQTGPCTPGGPPESNWIGPRSSSTGSSCRCSCRSAFPSDLVAAAPRHPVVPKALLHAASAQGRSGHSQTCIRRFTLTGNIGSEAVGASQLFKSGSLGLGAWARDCWPPIFNGGQLLCQQAGPPAAAFDAAAANYRQAGC